MNQPDLVTERRLNRAVLMMDILLGGLGGQRVGVLEAARRRRETMALLEHSWLPTAVVGRSGVIELANELWRALFGDGDRLDARLARHVESVVRTCENEHVPELEVDPEHRLVYCAATVRATRGILGAPTGGVVIVCDEITNEVVARNLGVDPSTPIWSGRIGHDADYVNEAWRTCAGPSATWEELAHPDDLARCQGALSEATHTHRAVEVEARMHCRDAMRWHRLTITPLKPRWFVTAVDIHTSRTTSEERAELLASALASRADAELANRRKDQFLAAVSHELRAPVTTMLLWDKVLRDEASDAPLRAQALDAIHDSAVAQARLVGDLLDIARAISGKLHVDLRAIDVNRIVAEALTAIGTTAAARGIEIAAPLGTSTMLVHGDAFRVRQILDNLLSNSLKFTDRHGKITVEISSRFRTVTITVTDTGRGIAAGFLQRIFEPFSQSEDAFTRSGAGLGLGLAISKQLVELQSGVLTVASPGPGLGSTFSITLPSAGRASSPTVAAHAPALSPHRIMIVDDDRRVLDALSLLLERAGAKVVTADSAEVARRGVADALPDLLLCDIAMPGEDGYTFISRLRASGVRIPSIALSAHAMEADAARALAAGFDAHVPKPIDFERLVAKIAELIVSRG